MASLILLTSLPTAVFAQTIDPDSVTPTGASLEDIISDFTGANKTDSSAPFKKLSNIRKLRKALLKPQKMWL
jgi:hypothetical protein